MPDRESPAMDEVFVCVREFIRAHGFAPTVTQLCAITGKKESTVRHLLRRLHSDGWITLGEGAWSQIDVVFEGKECLRCGRPFR